VPRGGQRDVSVLQALDRYYGRMADRGEAEAPGYSRPKISYALVLSADGAPVDVLDLRVPSGKRLVPRQIEAPAEVKRTVGILPNLLWDKTAYVFGRTAGEGRRTAAEHAAFRNAHLALLEGARDGGLLALRCFLENWTPARFDAAPFAADMLDANFVFRLEGEPRFIHQREAAQALVAAQAGGDGPRGFCLVSGLDAPVRRLHPVIKGVEGAQSSGAALVSFNLDAFASYGKEQGANAPTSEAAAFRYGAALNRMLDRGGRNRLPRPIGDTTVVFWADASDEAVAAAADDIFAALFEPPSIDPEVKNLLGDAEQAARLFRALGEIADGRPVRELDPRLDAGVRFYVLGLAPNAARLSVRFWLSDSFDAFAQRLAQHYADLAIEPLPWRALPPSVGRLLVKTTALQEKFENIPKLLAGEVTRAILAGTPYPRTLLATALIRLRAGDDPASGWHAAIIRAVLAREARLLKRKEAPPVELDRDNADPAYNLGRFFAVAEIAQRMALKGVKATIRDKYYGAYSAAPASLFPIVQKGMQNHLSKLRKEGKGGWVEREVEQIVGRLPPNGPPRFLPLEGQGRLAIGYYHQRATKIEGKPAAERAEEEAIEGNDGDE